MMETLTAKTSKRNKTAISPSATETEKCTGALNSCCHQMTNTGEHSSVGGGINTHRDFFLTLFIPFRSMSLEEYMPLKALSEPPLPLVL